MDSSRTAYVGGTLIDGTGRDPIPRATVVVNGARIEEAGPEARVRAGKDTRVVDVSGLTLMPGLFDCHVHISYVTKNIERRLFVPPSLELFQTAEMMKRTLHAGITTIRVPGTRVDPGFRMASEQGLIEAPRLVVAGRLGQTGGHFDEYYPSGVELPFADALMCDGVPAVQQASRKVLQQGFDFIKVCATGGVSSPADSPEYTEWTLEELRAMVHEADARGKAVMAHAQGTQGIKNALLAGVWSVEHGSMLDDEAIGLFQRTGTYLVPTLYIVEDILSRGRELGLSEHAMRKINVIKEAHVESFKMAVAAGVRMGVGTDIISEISHGRNAAELTLMVKYGMRPMDVIVAATKTSSEVCRVSDRTGTLEPGKAADMLAVDGDPLQDIALLQDSKRLLMVMKEGRMVVGKL